MFKDINYSNFLKFLEKDVRLLYRAVRKDLKLPKLKRRKYEESPLNETADVEQLNRNNNNKSQSSSTIQQLHYMVCMQFDV